MNTCPFTLIASKFVWMQSSEPCKPEKTSPDSDPCVIESTCASLEPSSVKAICPNNGGSDGPVTYIVFPNAVPSPVESNSAITSKGSSAANAWVNS